MITPNLKTLVAQGALVVANHSGGKDSQAMLIDLLKTVPAEQIVVVHASLGEAEWPGALEHAKQQAEAAGCKFFVAQASKTFFDMVRNRKANRPEVPSFPSSSSRQCTSDLKRDPIAKLVRKYATEHGFKIIINCLGIRAQESTARRKKATWQLDTKNTAAGRTHWNHLPIHNMTLDDVLATVKAAGQKLHYAYALGNERLSCVFCIMASAGDVACGAKANPELLAKYIALENEVGYNMHQSNKPLANLVAEAISQQLAA